MIKRITATKQNPPLAFKGINIAKTQSIFNGIKTEIDVYRLSQKDSPFLSSLAQTVDMEKLMPAEAKKKGFELWRDMLLYGIENALNPEYRSYLAATKNKPCGIINFKTINNDTHIECICTWPVKVNEKVKFAGKTLFNQVLNYHKLLKAEKITIEAILNGHSHPLERYTELGFLPTKNMENKAFMEMSRENAEKLSQKFSEYFTSIPAKSGKEVNLDKTLKLDY